MCIVLHSAAQVCNIMQHSATQCTYCAGETTDVVCMIMHTVQHSANLCTQCSTMQIYADMHMCADVHMYAHMCACVHTCVHMKFGHGLTILSSLAPHRCELFPGTLM